WRSRRGDSPGRRLRGRGGAPPAFMRAVLADRIAVVPGLGPGLGRERALACAREGAHVVLAARTAAALEEVAEAVRAGNRRALAVPTDLSRPDECQRLAGAARAEVGRIDVLVPNALPSQPLALLGPADLDDRTR